MAYLVLTIEWIDGVRRALERADVSVFRIINHAAGDPFLDRTMIMASTLGLGIVQSGVCLALILAGLLAEKIEWRRAGYAAGTALILAGAVSQALKHVFSRPRPVLVVHDARIVDGALFANSFPSGHTTTAFAAAAALSVFLPRMRCVVMVLACLTGLSRIYLGLHYPWDVVYGAALGTFIGFMSAGLFRPRARTDEPDEPTPA